MRGKGRSGWTLSVVVGGAALALTGAALVGTSAASEEAATASVGTITCPDVEGLLPDVPASAQAEVDRNLQLLQTQISEAQNRLETTVGQGGANFVQNAILGPLASKRTATIDRIAIAIGRTAARPDLAVAELSTCTVEDGAAEPAASAEPAESAEPATEAPETEASAPPADGAENGEDPAAQQISCPDVESQLPAIPAQAQAEVERNLALLDTQISEAENRLATSAGEGGANFVQNAILGPLADKRVATINRIATAIGRNAPRPELDVETLSVCSLA